MLIDNGDGTCTGGPLDVLTILHDVAKNRFHAAFFEEMPLPGPVKDVQDTEIVRLRCKMHHTVGAGDLPEALHHLEELAEKIQLPNENKHLQPMAWDGTLHVVIFIENWRRTALKEEP